MAKKDPLLSFVVPVYKKPLEVFENCLKSLRDMSYKHIEIIVVFDGEPEDVEMVSAARRYTPVDKIISIEHSGASAARNAGARLATGTYISFWDADCYAKPEMAKRWIEEFESSGADFVYAGYEFTHHSGGVNGHPFDPYLLTCSNYIATMFPMKREIFPGFDESLKGAQDWDLWLTIVEKGYRGSYIEGFSFITEPPSPDSISGKAWNDENYKTTHSIVRQKHNIPVRDMIVGANGFEKAKGLHVARLVNADYSQFLDFRPHDYKLALSIGFGDNIWFTGAPKDCVKIQYWMPWDILGLENYGFMKAVRMLKRLAEQKTIHWCNEMVSQKRLKLLFEFVGLPAPEIVPLPSEVDEAETTLPKDYRVLLDIDEVYMPFFKTIKQDLPYIQIDDLNINTNPIVKVEDYSLLVSFHPNPTIDEAIRRMLINGRNIISNVQAPYCGFFDLDVTVKDFKQELIRRIRDGRYLKFNKEGSDYYKTQVDPKAFQEKLKSVMPVKLEVL